MLFISDFSLPHPATRNHSTYMKLKEELCVSNHKNANITSISLKKHSFRTHITQDRGDAKHFLSHGIRPRLYTDNY